MAASTALLGLTNETTAIGNTISLKMVSFIETVKDQPAGFRDLGLDFLSICQILNALSQSLSSHFATQQAFPEKAIPELSRVLSKTMDDFKELEKLLNKFMDYEKGGAFARLQKTWRIMFADKDIAKVRGSLQASKGALTMAMLLTNINPNATPTPTGYEYGMLAAKLQHHPSTSTVASSIYPSPAISELPGDWRAPQELDSSSAARESMVSSEDLTQSISEVSISDTTPEPSVIPSIDHEPEPKSLGGMQAPKERSELEPKTLINLPAPVEQSVLARPELPRIRIDRSALSFTAPTSNVGATNAALQKALLSALSTQKHAIVTQLLSRGVIPPSAPVSALISAIKANDITSLKLLLSYGADPNLPAGDGNTPLRCACQYSDREACIELLLKYGADPNLCAPDMTPLPFALLEKNEKVVSMLLCYGADPNIVMKIGTTALLYACEREHVPFSCIEEMIRYGADPNIASTTNTTPLYAAVVRNRPNLVSLLLSHNANPDLPGPNKELPIVPSVRYPPCLELLIKAGAKLSLRKGILELATFHNQIESVKMLLAAGVDPNEKSQDVFSPLTTAIRDNRPELLELLLASGANPNLRGQDVPLYMATKTPALLSVMLQRGADPKKAVGVMEMAVYYNKIESVQILLDAGVDPNEKKDNCFSPLTTAIRDNRPDIITLLLSRGADPNFRGQDVPLYLASRNAALLKQLLACPRIDLAKQVGALEMAVYHNNIESVRLLLEAGVDPNEKKDQCFSPLTTAIRDNRPDILALLLKSGADPDFKGQDIPLVLAVRRPEILKMLLDGGADVKKVPGVVEAAVAQKSVEAIDILLAAGADINDKRMNTFTALTTALSQNSPEIITHLLSKGADPNVAGPAGLPLVMAAGYKDERLKTILSAKGLDVNKATVGGKTALMEACEKGIEQNVRLLLERGADVDAVDGSGRSAMDFAAAQGRDEILMLLLESMG